MSNTPAPQSMTHQLTEAALSFDALDTAEQATGQSYTDDADTMALGVGLMLHHNEVKAELLRTSADSYFNMKFEPALELFFDLGFTEVLRQRFTGGDFYEQEREETFVILWHPDGILATCESFGDARNTAKIYYNYRHNTGNYPPGLLTGSGGYTGTTWVGDHDVREGLRHKLRALRAEGTFLPVWEEQPFLWLSNYVEGKTENYEVVNASKIALLPEHVRTAIAGQGQPF